MLQQFRFTRFIREQGNGSNRVQTGAEEPFDANRAGITVALHPEFVVVFIETVGVSVLFERNFPAGKFIHHRRISGFTKSSQVGRTGVLLADFIVTFTALFHFDRLYGGTHFGNKQVRLLRVVQIPGHSCKTGQQQNQQRRYQWLVLAHCSVSTIFLLGLAS